MGPWRAPSHCLKLGTAGGFLGEGTEGHGQSRKLGAYGIERCREGAWGHGATAASSLAALTGSGEGSASSSGPHAAWPAGHSHLAFEHRFSPGFASQLRHVGPGLPLPSVLGRPLPRRSSKEPGRASNWE